MRRKSNTAGRVLAEVNLSVVPISLTVQKGGKQVLIAGNSRKVKENVGQVTILSTTFAYNEQAILLGHDLRAIAGNDKKHQVFIADAGLFVDDVGGIPIGNGYVYLLDT